MNSDICGKCVDPDYLKCANAKCPVLDSWIVREMQRALKIAQDDRARMISMVAAINLAIIGIQPPEPMMQVKLVRRVWEKFNGYGE